MKIQAFNHAGPIKPRVLLCLAEENQTPGDQNSKPSSDQPVCNFLALLAIFCEETALLWVT